MRTPSSRAALLLLLSASCAHDTAPVEEPPLPRAPDLQAAAATITPEDMRARIGFLASDALRGRDTPSPGLEAAAAYVASELMRVGLEPGGEGGTFYQRYPFGTQALELGASRAVLLTSSGARALEPGVEVAIEPGAVGRDTAGIVYVGERIPEVTTGGELRDRAVLVDLRGAPPAAGGRPERDWRSRRSAALRGAEAAGAAAVLFALDPSWSGEDVARLQAGYAGPRRVLGRPLSAFYLRADVAERLLRAGGLDPAAARARAGGPPLPLASVTAVLAAPARSLGGEDPPNVAGILRGSDPRLRGTYVVFSAHMDHVGVGRPDASGDSIYNGADDDASGTSAILEIAEAFAALPEPPARSIMFLAVSGEEKGLLGSSWFADHPTVPLESIVANVNIDMIARNAPDSIVVIGQEYSSLGPLVQSVARENPQLGLTVSEDIWPEERFFFRSDHFSFARKDIPALFFFAGVHEDYHRPSDEVETIDADKTARVARLIFYTAHRIAADPRAPEWTEEGLAEVRALTR